MRLARSLARCAGLCMILFVPLLASAQPPRQRVVSLNMLSSGGLQAALQELQPTLQRATGTALSVRYDTNLGLSSAIKQGTAFDICILTANSIQPLTAAGWLLAGSSVDIARSGIGAAVRAGAARPDISTVPALRRALLAAHSVAFTATGGSGIYFEQLLQRLGVAAAVNAKSLRPRGGSIAEVLARGDADLGVQQVGELRGAPGVEYLGALPQSVQHYTVFSACLSGALGRAAAGSGAEAAASAARLHAARTVLAWLQGPEARAAISAKGMQPMPVRSSAGP